MTSLKQFEKLVKESCRRNVGKQLHVVAYGLADRLVDREFEFCGEPDGAKHPHRIFAESLVGVAYQDDMLLLYVVDAADKVPDAVVGDVVVQRIAREVTSPYIFFDAAVNVVTNDSAFIIVRMVIIRMVSGSTKGGNLDNLPAETHVCQPEAPPDEAAVRKQRAHLVRSCIRGDIKVLGVQPHQCITYATANQERLITGFMQSVQYLERTL